MPSKTKVEIKWDKIGGNPLTIVSELQREADWLEEANAFVAEKEFEEGTKAVAKIVAANGNVPQPAIAALCVKLQGLSVIYRMRYNAYMSFHQGTEQANMKKNHYRSLYEGMDRLVDSLKYLVRNG